MPKRCTVARPPAKGANGASAGSAARKTAASKSAAPKAAAPKGTATAPKGAATALKGKATGTGGRSPASLMVSIEAPGVGPVQIPTGSKLQRAAMEWSWVVRNRARWAGQPDSALRQSVRARAELERLGIDKTALDAFAATDIIQVSVPFVDEPTAWEARVFPWEFVLSSVNRDTLANRPLIVRRLVADGGKAADSGDPAPDPALIVVSAPGRLDKLFFFEAERRLVEANLDGVAVETIEEDSDARIKARIAALKPKAIHLAGVDSYQGASLLKLSTPKRDGFLMADSRGVPRPVASEQLAEILAAGGGGLRMVACNFWNSASRTAAMAVAFGSEAAIGFQDQVDDSTAELFLATFYANWRRCGWKVAPAFEQSLRDVQKGAMSLKGSGVVLWSRRDLLAGRPTADEDAAEPPADRARPARKAAPAARGEALPVLVQDALAVEIRPLEKVNYSLLHNDRSMFETFRITKLVPDTIRGVEVEVVLYVGGDSYPYRISLDMKEAVTDFRKLIRVPLTSTVLRAFRENIRSVVYVGVKVGADVVFQNTWRITLVPVEEWSDDDEGGKWLPSFVMPRDPAVLTVVDAAYPMLRAIRDDGKAAFDGYQSVKPEASGEAKYRTVDGQVTALWSAMTYQFGLRYINPPPSYTKQSQRLRTPSEVLRSRSGTCIDLALLLAACLEYIDIDPVLFLLPGHAFPGFWRTHEFYQQFKLAQETAGGRQAGDTGTQHAAAAADALPSGWVHRTNADASGPVFTEVVARLTTHHVVPLETIGMTSGTAYRDAVKGATNRLGLVEADAMLQSMVDIRAARESSITPLPSDQD